jgi:hypothetical protein
MASAQLLVHGADCIPKAMACAKIVFDRVEAAGYRLQATNVELLGIGNGVPIAMQKHCPPEVVLRLSVRSDDEAAVDCFTRQIAPLITSGPAGLGGYAQGRPRVQKVMAHWPTLVPKSLIQPHAFVQTATTWVYGPTEDES